MKEKWSVDRANEWYAEKRWPVGCNYVPSTAVNSTEMWQAESFDEATIRRELRWARDLGMNTVRVFLQYIVWEAEGDAFLNTFERFLSIAKENDMTVLPILFDDCAFDFFKGPSLGVQPEPVFGVHNSRWTPSPGFDRADDEALQPKLREYVEAVVGGHRGDDRILAWDLYNEPGNSKRKNACLPLLVNAFRWARGVDPEQPLTSGVWDYNDDSVYRATLELSDIISFHGYTQLHRTREILAELQAHQRPIFNTEWLHRPNGNTLFDHLPLFHEKKVGCYQWGLVRGKTQTHLNWSTMMGGQAEANPALWQHDLLNPDGTPYDEEETKRIEQLTQ